MSPPAICIFCAAQKNPAEDENNFVLHRGAHNFVILNLYPYITGHLMIAPFAHVGELDSAPKEVTDEMMDQALRHAQMAQSSSDR